MNERDAARDTVNGPQRIYIKRCDILQRQGRGGGENERQVQYLRGRKPQ
jgi:hypothetical protein